MSESPPPAGRGAREPIRLTPTHLVLLLVAAGLLGVLEVGALEYAYDELGIPHRYFFALLILSWFGSLFNFPLMTLPPIPGTDVQTPTVVAVNVGGALIPSGLALWVLSRQADPSAALLAVLVVAGITYLLATPIKGVGIAMPMLVPPLAAAGASLVLAPAAPAATAYVGGTLGALLGADLLNLHRIRALGAPVVSIGGAGTFDGIFLTGILAVLLALA